MKKKGFTLVEMLIVISILSVVGVLILTIFTRTLRGGNKSQIIGVIKQNGQSVLEVMDKTVRNADNLVCPVVIGSATSASSQNLVVVKNGVYTRFRFINPVTSPAANGLIQQDNPAKQNVEGSNPLREETDSEFRDRVCQIIDTMPQAVILTDTNNQTGVSVESGLFTKDKSAGFKDQVIIKFNLNHGVEAPSAVAGQIEPVSFQTTVNLR